ncbi:hypothetical protein CROQUDRAFT_601883 [Cronartium quercuum f. sp. fusiforme G11]|uniref:Triacylglycerol lipase n=1 Tax=Cronartium quercuum f. sp. fusiforme G11 TaxID=708437 RepID=A0A9P6NVF2_9BASI|nr:hypothetical protein CROQUDRAFT_601883 [Cronartium quercuum f. sp. fusiforme G11]
MFKIMCGHYQTPYNVQLSNLGVGYDICWADLPHRSVLDVQLSAEYVAYIIGYLAKRSVATDNKIQVIGHSQGGGNDIQWALTFWPSIQKHVTNYVALSGPFKGISPHICKRLSFLGGCIPVVVQLSANSNYIAAQNSIVDGNSGAKALVPTTSIYTRYDEVIQNQAYDESASSYLPGAKVLALQNSSLCGKRHISNHAEMTFDPAAFNLAADAIQHPRSSSLENFDRSTCGHQGMFRAPFILNHWGCVHGSI